MKKPPATQTHTWVMENVGNRTLAEAILKTLNIEYNAESLQKSYGIEGDVFVIDDLCNINVDIRALRHIELDWIRILARGIRLGFLQACLMAEQGRV